MRTIHTFIEQKAPKYVRGSVLDIGGGWGRWRDIISPFSKEYYISDPFAKDADYKDDARNLSNSDESFDTVVCFEVLEHVDDTKAVVSEMRRVLKKGGHVIITVPFLYVRHGNPDDYHRFTPNGLAFAFREFEIVRTGTIGNVFSVLGCFCKARFKSYGKTRPRSFVKKWIFFALHEMFDSLYTSFPQEDDVCFTHSYIIAKKRAKRGRIVMHSDGSP